MQLIYQITLQMSAISVLVYLCWRQCAELDLRLNDCAIALAVKETSFDESLAPRVVSVARRKVPDFRLVVEDCGVDSCTRRAPLTQNSGRAFRRAKLLPCLLTSNGKS